MPSDRVLGFESGRARLSADLTLSSSQRSGHGNVEIVLARGRNDEPGGPSLFRLARWLVAEGCEDALILDGGPSTGAAWRSRTSTR